MSIPAADFPSSAYSPHTRRRSPIVVAVAALGLLALAACGHDAPTTPVAEPRIIVVSGSGQSGIVDSMLPVAFVVQLTDGTGRGIPNAALDWQVTSGAGDLLRVSGRAPFTTTDAFGRAAVLLRPTKLGPVTVTTSAPTLPGAKATFAAFGRRVPDVVVDIVPGFDCGDPSSFEGADGSSTVTVRVGEVVEWVYAKLVASAWGCTARLRSPVVPLGGSIVDAPLSVGDRFQFMPDVAGTWVFVDANNGGRGTVTVRE
jgi:hypothetical protein